jgi:co-chaperonin GroES (HSP10)
MKIKPTHERILVDVIETKAMTEGGIEIPTEARETPYLGTIVDIGNKVKDNIGEDIGPGTKIMFMKYSGVPVHLNGKEYKLILANEVIGIVEDE